MNKRYVIIYLIDSYILPVKPFSLSPDIYNRAIPTPDWRQFVVGKVKKSSPKEESYRQMMFWYKESLLGGLETRGRIVGRWFTVYFSFLTTSLKEEKELFR